MLELQGKYNTAKVFTDTAEASAISQIQHLLDQEFMAGARIAAPPAVFICDCSVDAVRQLLYHPFYTEVE